MCVRRCRLRLLLTSTTWRGSCAMLKGRSQWGFRLSKTQTALSEPTATVIGLAVEQQDGPLEGSARSLVKTSFPGHPRRNPQCQRALRRQSIDHCLKQHPKWPGWAFYSGSWVFHFRLHLNCLEITSHQSISRQTPPFTKGLNILKPIIITFEREWLSDLWWSSTFRLSYKLLTSSPNRFQLLHFVD